MKANVTSTWDLFEAEVAAAIIYGKGIVGIDANLDAYLYSVSRSTFTLKVPAISFSKRFRAGNEGEAFSRANVELENLIEQSKKARENTCGACSGSVPQSAQQEC